MLHRQIVVAHRGAVTVGIGDDLPHLGAGGYLGISVDLWLAVEQRLQRAPDLHRRHTQAVEERMDDPLLLGEKPQCEMLGKNRGMVVVLGKLGGGEQGFPAPAGEFFRVH